MTDYFTSNQSLWNRLTEINARSEFYDVAGFKAGALSLREPELTEVGDVAGKRLLHLQCHFGMDTLSWARMGAHVTGVDFSDEAINLARSLSQELNLPATFIHSNIYDLPAHPALRDEQFDIVFTSYGVLTWLPDLRRWAQVVRRFLRRGGVFYVVEFHPFVYMFDDANTENLRLKYPYFHTEEPLAIEITGSYADLEANLRHIEYSWTHTLSDYLIALNEAELRVEWMHEFSWSAYNCFPHLKLEEDETGRWQSKNDGRVLPLMFSIRAIG
ncbi:MAG: class I SAM-dependent methyltransferase [Pyrinomonadaceae bacterium MAG19_C2-C3]|nr:class I SAM-dependent methyltransferase [Pyrinomonadaceae bacterium MAG19_C2-C3]